MKKKATCLLPAGFFVLFTLVFLLSFQVGQYPITPKELLLTFYHVLIKAIAVEESPTALVLFRIRLPRILAGALVGGGLSAAGAAYQLLFRNPMAAPDVLGASSGAGFGAALALLLGASYGLVSLSAFLFGLVAVCIAYLISRKARYNPTIGMVLAGIMISSLFTSGTSLIKLLADPHQLLPSITYWLMGSLASVEQKKVFTASIPILLGLGMLFMLRWQINLLAMGDDEAKSMGINIPRLRILVVLAATLITAACVSISGMIGWVGLVIPHLTRMLVGYDFRRILPASLCLGATFMLLVDNLARTLSSAEIPLGVLTALVGAPFFLFLIFQRGDSL